MKESIKKEIQEELKSHILDVFIKLQDEFDVNMYIGYDTVDYMTEAALSVFMATVDVVERESGKEFKGTELKK